MRLTAAARWAALCARNGCAAKSAPPATSAPANTPENIASKNGIVLRNLRRIGTPDPDHCN